MAAAYTPSAQVKLTNVAYVRLQKKGKRFEIACYRNKILSWRNRVETDVSEVLQIDNIFANVSKGMLASAKDLQDAFDTTDTNTICREIMDKGEMQVSEQERGAFFDSMFRDVAAIVADKAINPENNRPYTISMIQNAMRQIHYAVSINKSAKSQALDVIRKLKDVMPISRASMLLRVVCPHNVCQTMKECLINDYGLQILKEVVVASQNESKDGSSMVQYDVRADPELFRKIEESIQTQTNGQGRLEVLQFRDSTPASTVKGNVNVHIASTSLSTSKLQESSSTAGIGASVSVGSKKKGDVKLSSARSQSQAEAQGVPRKTVFQMVDGSDSDSESDGDGDEETESSLGVDADITEEEVDEVVSMLVKTAVGKEEEEEEEEYAEEVLASDEEGNAKHAPDTDDDVEIVYGMATSKDKRNKKKKSKVAKDVLLEEEELEEFVVSSAGPQQQQQRDDISVASSHASTSDLSKKSKKAKRLEKEELKEKKTKMDELRSRIDLEKSRSLPIAPVPAVPTPVMDATATAATTGGQSCNTCGGSFVDSAAYRSHFRSEWHKHNLRRKMKSLPLVTSEEEFAALPLDQIEL